MTIEINNCKVILVQEKNLIVKDNKLFNTDTNKFEAIDGDKINFCTTDSVGVRFWMGGTVEGYTCNRRIKLKGTERLYASVDCIQKIIEHNSLITDSDYEPSEEEKLNEDWETVLSA
jgi:hypothetical protein